MKHYLLSSQSESPTSQNFNAVVIRHLSNAEYQFQVAAVSELDGEVFIGERSILNSTSILVVPLTSMFIIIL